MNNIGFNLLGAVIAFLVFQVIVEGINKLGEQRGVKIDALNKDDFIKKVIKSKNTVRIMETWTDLLSSNQFLTTFSDAIEASVRNNNTIFEILLLNPEDTYLVKRRQEDLSNNEDVEINIYRSISTIQKILQNLGNMGKNFQVKLYSRNPSLAIYMNDDDLFLTFFRANLNTSQGEQLKLPRNSTIGTFIIEEMFYEIWEDTKNTKDLNNIVFYCININNKLYDVKYIFQENVFYIQSSDLTTDSINNNIFQDTIIEVDDQQYKLTPEAKRKEDLPLRVQELFDNKYPTTEDIFFELIKLR
ncbi:hypothetical protein [Okeania sp.]|uniref:hypothetical protein n=1 Tax=Okeania sp. TaxID=3100323 RepID=UPI002B4B802F|nr:hypothetical protein [Okeania sp.]MEB3342430.1 hypothetical protein [Okeania sp.]